MTDVNNKVGIQPAVRKELNELLAADLALDARIDDIEAGVPVDGSITNVKLATDVKVGSLETLTTTEKTSVVGAINEVDANANTALGRVAANQEASTASTFELLLEDFNTLLASLKTAGLMVEDTEEG